MMSAATTSTASASVRSSRVRRTPTTPRSAEARERARRATLSPDEVCSLLERLRLDARADSIVARVAALSPREALDDVLPALEARRLVREGRVRRWIAEALYVLVEPTFVVETTAIRPHDGQRRVLAFVRGDQFVTAHVQLDTSGATLHLEEARPFVELETALARALSSDERARSTRLSRTAYDTLATLCAAEDGVPEDVLVDTLARARGWDAAAVEEAVAELERLGHVDGGNGRPVVARNTFAVRALRSGEVVRVRFSTPAVGRTLEVSALGPARCRAFLHRLDDGRIELRAASRDEMRRWLRPH